VDFADLLDPSEFAWVDSKVFEVGEARLLAAV
jgi:hypothetical protein